MQRFHSISHEVGVGLAGWPVGQVDWVGWVGSAVVVVVVVAVVVVVVFGVVVAA